MSNVKSLLAPLARRVQLMIGRAVLAAVEDNAGRQYVQLKVLKGETKDGVERVQQYGFTSHPLAGAQVILACLGGNRDHPVAISVDDHRHRPALQKGEVAIYMADGSNITLKTGNKIEMNTAELTVNASAKARFVTPMLEVTGDIKDKCDADGTTMGEMRTTYDSHTHAGDSGGTTSAPNQSMGGGA